MVKQCLVCSAKFDAVTNQRFCKQHQRTNERKQRTCRVCGTHISRRSNARYCSNECRAARDSLVKAMVSAEELRSRCMQPCVNPFCTNTVFPMHRKTGCSPGCVTIARALRTGDIGAAHTAAIRLGFLQATRVYFWNCTDCNAIVCCRCRSKRNVVCSSCLVRRRQRIDAKRNHKRRAAGLLKLSVHDLARRDGNRCHICQRKVDLSLSGMSKWGPTIDHLIPVSHGGTNDAENLALAHRRCNISRGNRGHAQLILVA